VRLRLEEQQRERAKTIDRLKTATKYNSTQQLLEKYGGGSPQTSTKPKPKGRSSKSLKNQGPPQRTGMSPPATANIPQNRQTTPEPTPHLPTPNDLIVRSSFSIPNSPLTSTQSGPPEFAPNAFPALPVYDHNIEPTADGKWYDRILDLLLGEDETSPKNRIVLICQNCRLVNGQAPPGVKRLQDVGRWRCIACGGWNGAEDEGAKVIKEIKKLAESEQQITESPEDGNSRSQNQNSDTEELPENNSPTE
jgi:endoplasmic reticulum junction formation protein lunapark